MSEAASDPAGAAEVCVGGGMPADIHLLVDSHRSGTPPGPAEVGGKAHNLMRIAALGLEVPPGFVIGTSWCARADELRARHWEPALVALERQTGLGFGDARRPLLVSVRSGAPVSMPGMMETLLDIGLCDATLPGLLRLSGDPRLAWDSYRRLVAGYGETVAGIPAAAFEVDLRALAGELPERELGFAEMRALTVRHLATYRRESGDAFPQQPRAQLAGAIDAVFASWRSPKAEKYRRLKQIDGAIGTAVTVQRMAFGNAGGISGAGVGFTRDPASGAPAPWVDFLFNAQGEDVVSGRRRASGHRQLAVSAPAVWLALESAMQALEQEFGDMQDFEFTVERGRLFLLQSREGKRTPQAAARIALDLFDAGAIDRAEARRRLRGLDRASLQTTALAGADSATPEVLAHGESACPGVVTGEIALDEQRAKARAAQGVPVVLVRQDAETSDIAALHLAKGLLTCRGARTSHAAVVARQLGLVCLVGCEALRIEPAQRRLRLGEAEMAEGDWITLDGHSGTVYRGRLAVVERVPEDLLARIATV